MKKVCSMLAGLILAFFIVGSAAAIPITWEDSLDFNPDEKISVLDLDGYPFYFDLGKDGYLDGMDVESYTLSISVYDDDSGWFETDSETVILATFGGVTIGDVSLGSVEQGWGLLGELDIEDDGTLNVWVKSGWGDFYLDSASIVVYGDDGTMVPPNNPVPEPASMILLGAGLLGLAGMVRRKNNSA